MFAPRPPSPSPSREDSFIGTSEIWLPSSAMLAGNCIESCAFSLVLLILTFWHKTGVMLYPEIQGLRPGVTIQKQKGERTGELESARCERRTESEGKPSMKKLFLSLPNKLFRGLFFCA